MTAPRPMLPRPPRPHRHSGEGWVHEAKLDGLRCLAQAKSNRVRLWSRAGGEWVNGLEELVGLSSVGDVVLDGEAVVVTADGQATSSRRQAFSSAAISAVRITGLSRGACTSLRTGRVACHRHCAVLADLAGVASPTFRVDTLGTASSW
jgi:hypothetical protein